MQFHQDTVERIRDSIFKIMINKNMVKEGLTFDDLIKDFPQFYDNNYDDDTSEDEYSEVPQVKEEIFNDNIPDDNIQDDNIPNISRFDPVAQVIGIRPGEYCEIIRPSKTGIN